MGSEMCIRDRLHCVLLVGCDLGFGVAFSCLFLLFLLMGLENVNELNDNGNTQEIVVCLMNEIVFSIVVLYSFCCCLCVVCSVTKPIKSQQRRDKRQSNHMSWCCANHINHIKSAQHCHCKSCIEQSLSHTYRVEQVACHTQTPAMLCW